MTPGGPNLRTPVKALVLEPGLGASHRATYRRLWANDEDRFWGRFLGQYEDVQLTDTDTLYWRIPEPPVGWTERNYAAQALCTAVAQAGSRHAHRAELAEVYGEAYLFGFHPNPGPEDAGGYYVDVSEAAITLCYRAQISVAPG